MTSKHTPGPWKCALSRRDYFYVYADDTSLVALCGGTYPGFWKKVRVSTDRQNANARLIAAAPDLLEALRQLYAATPDNEGGALGKACVAARAALAKAEGR